MYLCGVWYKIIAAITDRWVYTVGDMVGIIQILYAVEATLTGIRSRDTSCSNCCTSQPDGGSSLTFDSTVNSLLTHTSPWTPQAMGYDGVWGLRMVLKINPRILSKFWKTSVPRLWSMLGYCSWFKIIGPSQAITHIIRVNSWSLTGFLTLWPIYESTTSLFLKLWLDPARYQPLFKRFDVNGHAALIFEHRQWSNLLSIIHNVEVGHEKCDKHWYNCKLGLGSDQKCY
jgi:hypothetical protein